MKTQDVINAASVHFLNLKGHTFDVLTVAKPVTSNAAVNLAKVISKLSPLLGNLIEFNTVEILNSKKEFSEHGRWKRQDPGFPDAIFEGKVSPVPGFEIKAWFPMATEITARFKDSQNHFKDDNTYVALLAWLPESLIYGKPQIVSVCVANARSVAQARDAHYHNPPDYLVLEPKDTKTRTKNLQQTNTSGHKFQGNEDEFKKALKIVKRWGKDGLVYRPTPDYQILLRELTSRFNYRLDTNFAKIDRIEHPDIEGFKSEVYKMPVKGMTVLEWGKLFSSEDDAAIKEALKRHLQIRDDAVEKVVQ